MQAADLALLFVSSLLTAGLYAVSSYSITLVYGVLKLVDVSQGALITLGAYLAYTMKTHLDLDPLLTSLLVAPLFFLYGYLGHYEIAKRLLQKYSGGRVLENSLLLFFGLLLALTGAIYLVWKGDIKAVNTAYTLASVEFLGLRVYLTRLVIFLYAIAVTVFLVYLLNRTYVGTAIRAVSQDLESSLACGIDVERMFRISFGIACALSAAAGSLLTLSLAFSPIIGLEFILIAIVVTVVGGMGNFTGAFLGALLYAVVDSLGVLVVGPAYARVVALAMMVVVLVVRPQGLFGERGRI
ncbi:MAG: branched-chain amino acid ABC transporter permease [Nitrososphaerota archaeon]